MPINVGIDLTDTEEVRAALRAYGERYLMRVFTDAEIRDCAGNPRLLAGRFAAKEATMKALRRADEGLSWRSIGVRENEHGGLSLELADAAEALAAERGVTSLTLSLSYRRSGAAAVVLAAGTTR